MNSKKAYVRYAEQRAKKSPLALDCLKAFGIGGLICALGQGCFELYTALGLEEETVRALCAVLTHPELFDEATRVQTVNLAEGLVGALIGQAGFGVGTGVGTIKPEL